jgi:hypothetical protein
MDTLISEIQFIIDGFRKDEGVNIDAKRIKKWIEQFDINDQIFLLTELKSLFEKRYISKNKVCDFLKAVIEKLTIDYQYKNQQELLYNSIFLSLQAKNKSQTIILNLLSDVLKKEYNFNIKDCGQKSSVNCIYIDDILCTGNTLFQNIKDWSATKHGNINNYGLLKQKKINLILCYIFLHNKNYNKTISRLNYQIGNDFGSYTKTYRLIEVENDLGTNSKLDFIFPIQFSNDKLIIDYQNKIDNDVNNYCKSKNINPPAQEFYRNPTYPTNENFFSNPKNRNRFEKIILKKGIEILNNANTNIPNMRSLGYELPSRKNFGFGTLTFTYRNVPNNTPLVFWYSGGGFFPLFVKNPTSQQYFTFDDLDELLKDF